ncbi:hypothetical protein B0I35DRAFT_474036 [Stachybotrys elegans]|uniref:Uncharacterized protein n=1 Tax=Stachybotrys elegans TaxID=80388 RepID=A0A8K0WZ10_9HYPO|nr:hypothetical protein B0I35DRAFT_474036 [Stachybotrys elegans]
MGANLSIVNPIDKSGIVLAPNDLNALTCVLIDRWKGPHDKIRQGGGSVLVAFVLSAAWPVVMTYLFLNR